MLVRDMSKCSNSNQNSRNWIQCILKAESAHIYELTSFEFQSVSQLTHLSL